MEQKTSGMDPGGMGGYIPQTDPRLYREKPKFHAWVIIVENHLLSAPTKNFWIHLCKTLPFNIQNLFSIKVFEFRNP